MTADDVAFLFIAGGVLLFALGLVLGRLDRRPAGGEDDTCDDAPDLR